MPNNINKKIKDKRQQYNVFLNYSMQNGDSKFCGRLTLSIIALFLAFCFVIFIFALYLKKHPDNAIYKNPVIAKIISKISVKDSPGLDMPLSGRRQTILILGVDSNGGGNDSIKGTRSDTIILANIDPKTKSINMVSIPRDSKVYLADDKGINKINSAHALGGIDLTIKTIQDTFGVKINHYIIVHASAVKDIVNAIDGVPIYIEKNMHYDDYAGGLHVNLTKGVQVLNGKQAEGYLRFRHDGIGDIGRMARQQWFLRALSEKLQQPQMVKKYPEIMRVVSKNITTDMSFYDLSRLVATMKDINEDHIQVATLPGGPSKKGYISYWILDPEKTQEVIDKMIHREVNPGKGYNMVAGIMYSYDKEEEALEVKEALIRQGFEVSCMGRAQLPHTQFVAHSSAINSKFVNGLKKNVPHLNSIQFVFDPNKKYCSSSDFTIIISH